MEASSNSRPFDDPRPLCGVAVLDFTMNVPGPRASAVLARLGARVTKVEPLRGDNARLMPGLYRGLNAGKDVLRLDLRAETGRAKVRALAAASDIVLESFRPGVMERFGLSEPELARVNPRLIYCSISGFGQTGPLTSVPAHDLNLQALSGLAHMERDRKGRPRANVLPLADLAASTTVVTEVLAALRQRDRTGRGCHLDVALIDAMAQWVEVWDQGIDPKDMPYAKLALGWTRNVAGRLPDLLGQPLATWVETPRAAALADQLCARMTRTRWFAEIRRKRLYGLPHHGLFRTADARYLSLGIVDEDKFWKELCLRLGFSRLGALPLAARVLLAAPLRVLLSRTFAREPLTHWLELLGRDLPVTPVLHEAEAAAHPQLQLRNRSAVVRRHQLEQVRDAPETLTFAAEHC